MKTVREVVEELMKHDPDMYIVKDDGTEGILSIDDVQVIEARHFGNGEFDYPILYTAYPEIPITEVVIIR